MAKYSLQTEYEQAEESRKICKYNLENQKKKLDEINAQIVKVKNLLKDNRFLSANEYRAQTILHNYLRIKASRLTGLIQELEGALRAAEENLRTITERYASQK